MRGQFYQIAAPDFFMQLGEFAAHRGLSWPETFGKIGERGFQPRAAFKQHQRRRNRQQFGDAFLPAGLLGRQEAFEEKTGRSAGPRH